MNNKGNDLCTRLVQRVLDEHPNEQLSARDIQGYIMDSPVGYKGQTRRKFIPTTGQIAWALKSFKVKVSCYEKRDLGGAVTIYDMTPTEATVP